LTRLFYSLGCIIMYYEKDDIIIPNMQPKKVSLTVEEVIECDTNN